MIRVALDRPSPPITMEIVSDPVEIAKMNALHAQAEKNAAWLQAHAQEVYSHRGKYFCVAGQELFVADTFQDVIAAARAKHPDDQGHLCRYIPIEQRKRI
jgi:hypothetical protein